MTSHSAESRQAAFWRIVPKCCATDHYRRRFETFNDAVEVLGILLIGKRYEIVAFNAQGKRLTDA